MVLVLSAVVTTYLLPYLKNKIGENKYNELTEFITYGVQAMKQYYTDDPENNHIKKARVTAMAKEYMRNLKINLTDAQLDMIIEGVYNGIKESK